MKAPLRTLAGLSAALLILGAAAAVVAHLLVPGGILPTFGAGAAAPKEAYTCPMVEHADVRADGPGPCPKCGMDLVPISRTEHKGMKPVDAEKAAEKAAPKPAQKTAPPAEKGKKIYVCPMPQHSNFRSDRPGTCPICNMALVPLEEEEGQEGHHEGSTVEGRSTVSISPERRQLIGVTTGTVEKKDVKKPIRAAGLVSYDERKLSAVTLKFGGWIEELHVKAVGDRVKKGQPLLAIYSPDLLEAQRNYLAALEIGRAPGSTARPSAAAAASLEQSARSARERLLLWDISEDQIREIEAKKDPQLQVVIRSKVEGVVTERNVVQGEFVAAGMALFRLADLSTVWLDAAIYESEVPLVKPGDVAKVTLSSLPGEVLDLKVSYVYPTLNAETRTVRVRLEAENTEGKLKPGMYAEATIEVDLGEHLVVDEEAVFDTGTRQLVFVDFGDGRLEPREVKAGPRAGGLIVVLEGLKEGERVATSGNFLIDAESRIRSALRKGGGGSADGHVHGSMDAGKPAATAPDEGPKAEAPAPPAPQGGHQH